MTVHAPTLHPVSWLRLEQFHLGELAAPLAAEVDQHLADCAHCQARLDEIRAGEALSLPPLRFPVSLPETAPPPAPTGPLPTHRWANLVPLVLAPALAVAAATLLTLQAPTEVPPASRYWKGGELAIELVRERAGVVTEAPAGFAPGDRFQVRLTVPPPAQRFDVAVFQDGAVYRPMEGGNVEGGNRTMLLGAFVLDGGGQATVCVWVGGGAVAASPAGLGTDGVCAVLGVE